MINVENISYQYPQSSAPVLTAFSASFKPGEIVALRGRNGCGKTTLTKLLAGILRPSQGTIQINETDISQMDLFAIGQRLGYVFQNPNRQLFCDTVYQEVAFGLVNLEFTPERIKEQVDYYLDYFGLSHYRETFPGKLSHGEKQRLALAAVLALGTDYLALDEPTTGLDVSRRGELGRLLHRLKEEQNCGIIIASHDDGFITRYADRELVMGQ